MSDSQLVDAYVLHTRKYRDTSLIVELFTREEGRVAAVIRGARGKRSRVAGQIRPFKRFMLSWFGRGELKTVKIMDFPYASIDLAGKSLLLGLYVNELLYRVTGKFDPMPGIFEEYARLLADMASGGPVNIPLRRFELTLLNELGYGITFESEAGSGRPVEAGSWYRYVPDEGFHEIHEPPAGLYGYKGEHLIAITNGELAEADVDASAKRVIRASFAALLGDRELKSRELFRKFEELT
ncbi:MAG: DNA repair protein RecO [Pseudomonadales bacterium]